MQNAEDPSIWSENRVGMDGVGGGRPVDQVIGSTGFWVIGVPRVCRNARRFVGKLSRPILATALVFAMCGDAAAAEIDRLLAAVNGKVITESDLRLARNLNVIVAFGQGGSAVSERDQLDRLVNREILRQELENFPLQPEDRSRADARLAELRNGYVEIGGITHVLRGFGLQETEIEAYLQLQASMMRFIELRFRPFVDVTKEEIGAYYTGNLEPALKKSGTRVPGLEEVSAQIEGILIEEKLGKQMDEWIRDIRRHSKIEFFGGEAPPPGESPR